MSLYIRAEGSADNEAIVFLHGGGLSSAQWVPLFPYFASYYCLAPDLPEQGKSAEIGPFTLEDAARRVAEMIQVQVPGQKAHVVGVSAGAAVAMRLLQDRPDVVDHMLVSGAPARVGRFLARLNDLNEPVMSWLKPEWTTDLLMKQFHTPSEYRELILEGIREGKPAFIRHYDHELTRIVLPSVASVPLLIAVGEKETAPAKKFASQLVREIQGAQGVQVPQLGHFWCLEDVGLFSETILTWITDRALPASLQRL